MITPFLVLKIGVFLLIGLLYAEWREGTGLKLAFKAPLSVLFVITGLIQPQTVFCYWLWIVIGLVLCLGGDVCLALKQEGAFKAGLVSFLLGHVAYLVAFFQLAPPSALASWRSLVVIAISGGVFAWLRPHLGRMLGPVLAYIVVISLMVMGAWAVYLIPELPARGAGLMLYGAVAFYLSDIFVARDRFVSPGWVNRVLGLPLYYLGQFLLAFSIGSVS